MREILFRGKGFNGEWEYGVPVFSGLNNELAFMKQMHSYDHQVSPETVGQCTGVTDKNGKKIFEGDIVKGWKATGKLDFEKAVVCWDDLFSQWKVDGGALFGSKVCAKYEVIGNIHDNPELLKGGAE